MVEKYIIDKSDIHDLLKGEELSLTQGRARAFQVEVAGHMTNGELIKALFPKGVVLERDKAIGFEQMIDDKTSYCSWFDTGWWNESYGMDERRR